MTRPLAAALAALAALAPAAPAAVKEHPGRREAGTPGLVLETGARTGACDVLLFTADGGHLLAAGDDKVVRTWAAGPAGALTPGPTLRWPTFRESRGNIYAAALSPDEKRVVVAGHGQLAGGFAAAVLDRATGGLLHSAEHPKGPPQGAVWAAAFAPDGRRVALGTDKGGVWVWDPVTKEMLPVGAHRPGPGGGSAAVKFVAFDGADRVVSVAGTGEMTRWPAAGGGQGEPVHRFAGPVTRPAALSPDGRWLAAVPEERPGEPRAEHLVELVSFPAADHKRTIPFRDLHRVPHRLAFGGGSRYLAVAVRAVDWSAPTEAGFFRERGGRVEVFDLSRPDAAPAAGPTQGLYAEAVAFDPTNPDRLAVADATNHDVLLWDLKAGREVGRVAQPGRCLWGVGFSADGKAVGFRDQLDPAPADPNRRGAGPWRVFDLAAPRVDARPGFAPRPPAPGPGGWRLVTRNPANPRVEDWYVQKGPAGALHKLPLNRELDEFPRCYAFVPPHGGRPDRLVVGHYWGASVFDLPADGGPPARARVLRGHDGPVTAVDVFVPADGGPPRVATASRDMTVAGWALADWKYHPQLGAEFYVQDGKLLVGQVDSGSPAWELGLTKGDEVVRVSGPDPAAAGGYSARYDRAAGRGTPEAGRDYARGRFPVGDGKSVTFDWARPGDPGQVWRGMTTLADRPLWRLFPHGDRDWVAWRGRDYYYDCSAQGDFAVGWQKNGGADDRWRTPKFFRAEQFRRVHHRPDKVRAVLADWGAGADPAAVPDPPVVKLTARPLADGGYRVTVTAAPAGPRDNDRPKEVRVWLNDHLLRKDAGAALDRLAHGEAFKAAFDVPAGKLRRGDNVLVAQCDGRGGARGDSPAEKVAGPVRPPGATVHAVFAAVTDYSAAKPRQDNLASRADAEALIRTLERQEGKGAVRAVNVTRLFDREVTRAAVKAALERAAAAAKPDDLLVFHLGGHGTSPAVLRKDKDPKTGRRLVPDDRLVGLGSFLFVGAGFDLTRLHDTTIGFDELHDWLAAVPCHKLVLLDACHSGQAPAAGGADDAHPVRVLTRHGVGCVIMAACEADESALEKGTPDFAAGGASGLFSIAIRQAFENKDVFAKADRNGNGVLEVEEVAASVRTQVGVMVGDIIRDLRARGDKDADLARQNPVFFLPDLEKGLPVAAR